MGRKHIPFLSLLAVIVFGATTATVTLAQAPTSDTVLDDPFVREKAKLGLDLLYDMRFAEATAYFDEIDRRYDEHPIGPFLLALTTWWKILLDFSSTEHDDTFYAAMEEVIRRSDAMLAQDEENLDAMFFKGTALGFRGRLRSNRREWIRAASDGKRAMDYVLTVARRDTSNHDYTLGVGLYHYYAAVIPEKYPFARTITTFLPKGDRQMGLRELHRAASQGYYVQTEATYFLLQIYYLFENDFAQSTTYVNLLRERHPNNPFFHSIEGRIYARWGIWNTAAEIFEDILERYKNEAPGYNAAGAEQALYYLARAHMIGKQYREALNYLLQLEALSARLERDTYFKVMGRLHQGMVYDALGQRKRAENRYRQVLSMQSWSSSRKQARQYLKKPYGSTP